MLQHIIIQFLFNYLPTGRSWEVKNKKKIKFLALKQWSQPLTRGGSMQDVPNYSDLTWKFW